MNAALITSIVLSIDQNQRNLDMFAQEANPVYEALQQSYSELEIMTQQNSDSLPQHEARINQLKIQIRGIAAKYNLTVSDEALYKI